MKTEIYTAYAKNDDLTFIMKYVSDDSGEPISTECVGWYHGEPDESATNDFIGKLKAEY